MFSGQHPILNVGEEEDRWLCVYDGTGECNNDNFIKDITITKCSDGIFRYKLKQTPPFVAYCFGT